MAGPSVVPVRSDRLGCSSTRPRELTCALQVELVHNNHTHAEPLIAACEADVTIEPLGCDGNDYSWRFTLTVTDPEGLTTLAVSQMVPDCPPTVCGDGDPDGSPCSDGDVCSAPDQCAAGICTSTPLPDTDLDGSCDAVDSDDDGDGKPDVSDNCPLYATPIVSDIDGDGRGNACECTDQNGDGRNTVADLIAINNAIFDPALVTSLCDGNNDGLCNVNDFIAANVEIFSPT